MIELNPTKSRTPGPVALGVIAATLAIGCGSGEGAPGPSGGEQTSASRAAITSRGFSVDGCAARGVFDIVAPTPIDFVAMDPAGLQNAQMQLYTLDSAGLPTPVQKTAQQASPQLQSQFDSMKSTSLQANQLRSLGGVNQTAQGTTGAANAWKAGNDSNSQSAGTSRWATSEGSQINQSIAHQSSYNGNGASQATAANTGAQSAASQSSASALVIAGLSQLYSTHMMLVVSATTAKANTMLRLFQGSSGVLTDAQNFPIVTPACRTGA